MPLDAVELLDSPFRQNQARNTTYLLFLDPERMLRSFRLNYGEPTTAEPLGGWEKPDSQIRGHMTGHLLSGLALTYANTGDGDAKSRGQYLVSQLAAFQAKDSSRGFHAGYLSAFPEGYFDILEQGKSIWAPYYMIHKYLAGMIDQYQLAGDDQALDVAKKLGDWVDWRTHRLSYDQMQMILQTEFGGLPEALANLYTITGQERYLAAAQRFYHAIVLDPLAEGMDNLPGLQANVTTPKIIACLRMWEETGSAKYRDIARNFWDIVTGHHVYVIGGVGNYEHFQQPDTVAAQLSNFTCENCVSYNMLKLTRLLHFHQPRRVDLLDYYERTLLNQMLGEQDPGSPHGFNCYYTGLSAAAFKRQPLNYFPQGNPDVYATDWDTFTCDTATGLETQAKFADTIYSRDAHGLYVNLYIPSQVTIAGLVLRQDTGFPDDPVIRLSVVSGAATVTLRVRVPKWVAGPPVVSLNGAPLRNLPGARPEQLGRAPAALAGGRRAPGDAAHAAGRRADAGPPGGAGADLRPRRAERRARQQPRHADAAARDGLDPPDGRPADDVRGRRRPQAGHAAPDRPGRTRVLHHLLPDGVVLAAGRRRSGRRPSPAPGPAPSGKRRSAGASPGAVPAPGGRRGTRPPGRPPPRSPRPARPGRRRSRTRWPPRAAPSAPARPDGQAAAAAASDPPPIRPANTDAVMLPNTATPSTLPMLRVVSLTAEPTPAMAGGSSRIDAEVAADMASPMPALTMTMAST